MKKKLFLSILAVAAMLVSCNEKEPEAKDEISVTPAEVEIDYTEQEVSVSVKASGEWMLDGYSKWVKTTDMEGKGDATITFKAKKNFLQIQSDGSELLVQDHLMLGRLP